jgi:hypothetical protein
MYHVPKEEGLRMIVDPGEVCPPETNLSHCLTGGSFLSLYLWLVSIDFRWEAFLLKANSDKNWLEFYGAPLRATGNNSSPGAIKNKSKLIKKKI